MKKEIKMIVVLCSMLILGCSASLIINKGDNNVIDTDVKSTPSTKIALDSLSILNNVKDKNKNNN